MRTRRAMIAASLLALHARAARANPSRDDAHEGLMLRAALGLGYLALRGDGSPLEAAGMSLAGHLAAGWYVVPGFAVHATLWSHWAFNPNGTSVTGLVTEARQLTPSVAVRGLGVTWVSARSGSFVSASAGVSSLSMEAASEAGITVVTRTDYGYAFELMAGHPLWGSGGWRFGVAALGSFTRNDATSRGTRDVATTGTGSVVLTLTYH